MTSTDIPVINYHKIEPEVDIGITSRHPDRFERDLQLLAKEGYQTLTFHDLAAGISVPEKALIITFDDAYESTYTFALPRMSNYGFRGVVYVPVAYIGKTNDWDVQFAGKIYKHLSHEQLREMSEKGFELGSHGLTHRLLRSMDAAELGAELVQSKQILENISGAPILSISYPFGRYNRRILQLSAEAGYLYGVGAIRFNSSEYAEQNLCMRRFNVYRYDSDRTILKKTTGNYKSFIGLRDWLIQKGGLATAVYQGLFMTRNHSLIRSRNTVRTGN